MRRRTLTSAGVMVAYIGIVLLAPRAARPHCDSLDGPVVRDARQALKTGDLTPVLKWVRPTDEPGLRQAFRKARAVRTKGPDARELADMWFFETVVRLHRTAEGQPYTGLKPAGRISPVVAAADKALQTGSVDTLVKMVTNASSAGLRRRFAEVAAIQKRAAHSAEARRRFVAAYTDYIHYVEQLHSAALGKPTVRREPGVYPYGGPLQPPSPPPH